MKKRLTALALALVMLASLAVGALADEQTAGASETTATAPDAAGTVSFENLRERVRTGSYTVLALEENIAAIECIDYDKMYEDLRKGLNQIADMQWYLSLMGQGESYTAASFQQQYDSLRETFDALKDGELQEDNEGIVRQLRNVEDTLLSTCETMYATLLTLTRSDEALTRQSAALDRTVREVELRYELGQSSAMQLEEVKNGRTQLESGQATLQMNIAQLRRQLNSMLGEELGATLTLGALPAVTAEQLAAMDLEKDLEKAKAASYELYAAKKTLDDADETYKDKASDLGYNERKYEFVSARHQWQAAQYTYNAAVQSYELSFRALYENVKNYAQILTAAQTALACERADLETAQLKYEQGSISENALRTAEDDLYAAQDTAADAECDLFTAYNNYCWAVEYGLLNG